MKLHAKLTALSLTAALLLTGCGTSITGITLGVPQTMERGSTGVATPEYVYSGATPEQAKTDELVDKLGLTWSSSDPAVVMVDADGNLAAVGTGTAEVALSSEDGKLSASGVVKVVVSPTGLTLPETLTLTEGGDGQSLAATVEPADATDYTITYASSDESVAAVDAAGNVTTVAAGEADVTAEIAGNGLMATCHVVVTPAVEALYLSDDAVTLGTGDDATLTLYAEPEEVDVSAAVWTSSDESIATVDKEGTVTAVAEGEATVTATLGGMQAACEVTVSDKAAGGASGGGASASSSGSGSSAPAATSYGAIPFSLAAGTQEWWHIDSTDDAYWATLENINAYRAAVGVAPLSVDSGLSQIAYTRTLDMVRAGTMSHDGYQTPEIIAQNYNSAQSVVDAWAASPGHYAAMTDPGYTVCGIACEFEEGGATYWCVTFG
ncbi:MAG: Ig-like domain-containing protein [Gemmiger sp.]|uniref:Ig-like domain-containing protein n=1 Tax=Gemmiger sp. TaxID=2049027 RepID=UPI002E78943F|nr:Ig-like domain-containing protein [Gemmiger sp.]MEE0707316.1 Ig-like domain-containing protein [Gemmiger sp.]